MTTEGAPSYYNLHRRPLPLLRFDFSAAPPFLLLFFSVFGMRQGKDKEMYHRLYAKSVCCSSRSITRPVLGPS